MKWLFTFFMLCYIVANAQTTANTSLPITYKEIDAALKTDGKIVLTLIQFENGTDKLLPQSEPQIKEISRYMAAYKRKVYIVVHTDNTLAIEESIALSETRAEAIRKELSDNYLIAISMIEPKGVGSLCPVTSNYSAAKSKNNRVELVLQ